MDVRNLQPIEGLRDPVPASGYNAILHAVQRLIETPPAAVMGRTGLPGFFRVDSSTQDGSNQRWIYTLVEVHKASTGYDGWEDLPLGRQVTARNTAERDGADTPVPNGTVVHAAPVMSGVNLEWWFTYVRPGSGSGSPVRWGKVIGGWSSGNTVQLRPCAGQQDGTPTGEQDVVAYIVHPHGVSPRPLDLAEGAIVPFVTVGDVSVLLPVRLATLDMRWGKVVDGWSHGNTVLLIPCVGPLDGTPTGGPSVLAYIVLPHGVSPRPLDLAEGAIVPFVTVGEVSVLLSVRVATLDLKNNGSTAIATTRQINIPAQSNSVLEFDGSDLKLRSSLSDGKVPIWDHSQGKWVIDWVWLV